MLTLRDQRSRIEALFDIHSAVDAPTAYYALYHDPARSVVHSRLSGEGKAVGFVGRFQTGVDLFRPLLVMRCWQPDIAADLLEENCTVGRPYLLFANLNQLALVGGSLNITAERILSIYALDLSRFRTEINVLVRRSFTPGGMPRAVIESQGVRAEAGVNWQSPGFAEVYVQVAPEARGKGWGKSVVTAVCEAVRANGRLPIYLVEVQNTASTALAESVGFQDSGARQIFAEAVYVGHPGRQTSHNP